MEGDREQLTQTFSAISRDTRHHGVTLMEYAEIDRRDFPSWSMKLVRWPEDRPAGYHNARFDDFTPEWLSGSEMYQMILSLVEGMAAPVADLT